MTEDRGEVSDVFSPDPDDNYPISRAAETRSVLVSGDSDLLQLAGQLPVYSPAEFLTLLEEESTDTS